MNDGDFVDRVYAAMHQVRMDHFDATRMVVNVAPDIWRDLKITPRFNVVAFDGDSARVFGLPLVENRDLENGEIVLRYEVAA